MEFSRQEYWSGYPFPSPGDLPNPGIKPGSPGLQANSILCEPRGKPTKCQWLNTIDSSQCKLVALLPLTRNTWPPGSWQEGKGKWGRHTNSSLLDPVVTLLILLTFLWPELITYSYPNCQRIRKCR